MKSQLIKCALCLAAIVLLCARPNLAAKSAELEPYYQNIERILLKLVESELNTLPWSLQLFRWDISGAEVVRAFNLIRRQKTLASEKLLHRVKVKKLYAEIYFALFQREISPANDEGEAYYEFEEVIYRVIQDPYMYCYLRFHVYKGRAYIPLLPPVVFGRIAQTVALELQKRNFRFPPFGEDGDTEDGPNVPPPLGPSTDFVCKGVLYELKGFTDPALVNASSAREESVSAP